MCFLQRLSLYIQAPSAGRLPSISSFVSVYFGPQLFFLQQCAAATEVRFLEVHEPAEVQFKWRLVVLEIDGLECLVELHRRHDEGRLEPRHVGCCLAVRLNAVVFAGGVEVVPHLQSEAGLDPELVAEIPGETRTRHHERVAVVGKHDESRTAWSFRCRRGPSS